MAKHKAVIVGAGRIGAGYNWNDDAYTHAGAYRALKDRVELVAFVDPDREKGEAAWKKWGVPFCDTPMPPIDLLCSALEDFRPDIVSVCTPPDAERVKIMAALSDNAHIVKGVWCEKPYVGKMPAVPTQVNYLRRADPLHRDLALTNMASKRLVVYGKDDETTRCHFRDLVRWWGVPLEYRPFQGPCAYILERDNGRHLWFDNGGINPGECMVGMLRNLLDAVDNGTELWSPPYVE